MQKAQSRIVAIFLIFLGGLGVWFFTSRKETEVIIGGHEVKVAIARTPEARAKGLSGKKALCPDCGLLFIFESAARHVFWMKQMYFDIDIIWIDGDKIVDISHAVPRPRPEDFDAPKTFYQARVPVDKVLEVNSGWAAKHRLVSGDRLVTYFCPRFD